jgi:hypothetical protein
VSGHSRFVIAGLTVSVSGYQYPTSDDVWDGNWLVLQAELVAPGCEISHRGAFVRTDELAKFEKELSALQSLKSNVANLDCMEPYLDVCVARDGSLGALEITVSLTPDNLNQTHNLKFSGDLSDIPNVISELRQIGRLYPVRGLGND